MSKQQSNKGGEQYGLTCWRCGGIFKIEHKTRGGGPFQRFDGM